MKPEVKVEGKMLKFRLAQEAVFDSDKDGVSAAKASVAIEAEVDGLELVDELVKSSEFVAKIKATLGL